MKRDFLKAISSITCIALLLAGCSSPAMRFEAGPDKEEEFLSMNREPELLYASPIGTPHIIVDRSSYDVNGEKVAFFDSDELPRTFEVVSEETGEVVYRGSVITRNNLDEGQEVIGYGTFSDLKEEGRYYVQSSKLGQSYSFEICQDGTRELFPYAIDEFRQFREKKVTAVYTSESGETADRIIQGGWITDGDDSQKMSIAAETMVALLTAYELYPQSFEEYTNDAGQVSILDALYHESVWMLSMQDETSGGVFSQVISKDETLSSAYELGQIDEESSAAFAAAMAKFSYVYKEVDQEYASLCLKAADLAWKYITKNNTSIVKSEYRPILADAAVELYRASGLLSYYTDADSLLKTDCDYYDSDWNLYAAITYMYARKSVDKTKCAVFMKKLLSEGETISNSSRADAYLVSDDVFDRLSWNMVLLSTANYVLTNDEYSTVLINYQHYLRGRNSESKDYIFENGEYIVKDLRSNAKYVYTLAQILSTDYFVAPSDNDY